MERINAIKALEMVADDLFDSCQRTMACKIREVVEYLERTEWHIATEDNLPEEGVPVLVECIYYLPFSEGEPSKYYVVAERQRGYDQWIMSVKHEAIYDKIARWKTIE